MNTQIIYPIIENPRFLNGSMTMVGLTLKYENGTTSNAELRVPENRATGVNAMWDRIMAEHDVNLMEQQLKNRIEISRKQDAFKKEKQQAALENQKLKHLFGLKVEALNLPFVQNTSDHNKKLIRKAPNVFALNFVLFKIAEDHMQTSQIDLEEFLEQIEDHMWESSQENSP